MKSTILLCLASVCVATKISYTEDYLRQEMADRKTELEEARKEHLTSKWMNRIDNYDPDLDQEMATDVLNASKRESAIKRLQAKVDGFKLKGYGDWNDLETSQQMLETLKKEQAGVVAKSAALGSSEFDTPTEAPTEE